MKALSILQPWASLIVCGDRRLETRSWQTRHRGPLLLHAGRRRTNARRLIGQEPYRAALRAHGWEWCADLPFGFILGFAELVDCIPAEALHDTLRRRERALGDFRPGRWAWLLERPTPLTIPFALRGALGVFDVDDALLDRHVTAAEPAALAHETQPERMLAPLSPVVLDRAGDRREDAAAKR